MIITYHGASFIKVQQGDSIVAVNPISKDSKHKTSKFGADVALSSSIDPDVSGIEEVSFGERIPFVIKGPGEYEVKGIFIKGFLSQASADTKLEYNTIYSVMVDGMHLVFLGQLGSDELSEEALEALSDIDILFVSVGGKGLSPSKAYKLSVSLESKLIIPLGDDDSIKTFLKESSTNNPEKLEKLTIKKKDLDGKEGEIKLLSV